MTAIEKNVERGTSYLEGHFRNHHPSEVSANEIADPYLVSLHSFYPIAF